MSVLERVRRPEYTGDSRCWPCTAVNTVVVGAASVLAALLWLPAALPVLLGGLLLVYLRGYVVPYTPKFAPKLVDHLPIDVGPNHGPGDGPVSDSLTADDVGPDPEAVLGELLEVCILEGDEDLSLSESFEEDWTERMSELADADEREFLDRAAAAARGDVSAERHGDRILLAGGRDVWLSRPVAIAETAAVEALADRGIDPEVRTAAARPLRLFLKQCPDCGGTVAETTVRRCCGGPGGARRPEREVLACESCEVVLFEFDEPDP
ncbi:Membrane associated protein with Zn zinger domain [Halalkaliarchaeum sp. AArc-CO]|uniref:hypothetical protein n=1 Tax=unclassified Halalkaliarchaeum TaxID=2678344 RepID=UPI00217F1C3E|nr:MULTISPECIES: hypothetical protein [unclassified Halalkaliarchaeum]MDR5672918.1 hypothetical protein [Halalkaliarchaeum sp. AArc-GB]UWG50267.1 Membrane associated protein with Zn zinger domain [Halalkaliarchaeum sp. AArc-CO]